MTIALKNLQAMKQQSHNRRVRKKKFVVKDFSGELHWRHGNLLERFFGVAKKFDN